MNLEEDASEDERVRWLRRAVWLLLAIGLGACLSEGANSPPDPTLVEGTGGRSAIDGFGEVGFTVQTAGTLPTTSSFCALLADTAERRQQGLMGRSDLSGYDGMVFAFDGDVDAGFHMKNTLIPLTVAWFDAGGRLVGAVDMTPCPGGDCPTYDPPGPYRFAIEVLQGDLARLAIAADSTVEVGGACG